MEGDAHTLEVIATFFELPRDGMTTDVYEKRLEWAMTLRRLGARIVELEIGLDEAVKVVRQNAGTISALRVHVSELEAEIKRLSEPSACDEWGNPVVLSVAGGSNDEL